MFKHIIYVPIEPLTERYTEQWYRNFPIEFENAGYTVQVIDGKPLIKDDIKTGTFLDINSTTHYKWSQLQQLSLLFYIKEIPDNSIIFFGDIEFWGLEAVRLLADMNNVSVKIVGFLHAASYTKGDAFEIAAPYQKYTELGWIASCDQVYVGSAYHKQAVIDRRLKPQFAEHLADRIIVTKNPIFTDEYTISINTQKQKKILLTNRFDKEKEVRSTLELFNHLKHQHPQWEFVITTSRKDFRSNDSEALQIALKMHDQGLITIKSGLTKQQYHEELASAYAIVTHSLEESYGYCIAEALLYGTYVFATNAASHPEFVSDEFLFTPGSKEDYTKLNYFMMQVETNQTLPKVCRLDTSGMQNIVNSLIKLS